MTFSRLHGACPVLMRLVSVWYRLLMRRTPVSAGPGAFQSQVLLLKKKLNKAKILGIVFTVAAGVAFAKA